MRILILTGKFGMGHWSASQSLRQQLLRAFPGAEVEVLDLVAQAMPNASDAMYKCFNLLVTRGSGLFNLYYKLTRDLPADTWTLLDDLFLDELFGLMVEKSPDAVIATHPLCARMVSRWKGATGSRLPLITCVTDLSSHSEWIHKYTDCYLVGSNDIREKLAAKGVERESICVTGIPVRCEFKAARPAPGGGRRRLLIMGGGLGLMPRKDSFYEALMPCPMSTPPSSPAGTRSSTTAWRASTPTSRCWASPTGCTSTWPADLVLTKPGGITLFESIFSELPILAWEPFLEQEKLNARFLVKRGLAAWRPRSRRSAWRPFGPDYNDGALEPCGQHAGHEGPLEEESLARISPAWRQRSAGG